MLFVQERHCLTVLCVLLKFSLIHNTYANFLWEVNIDRHVVGCHVSCFFN